MRHYALQFLLAVWLGILFGRFTLTKPMDCECRQLLGMTLTELANIKVGS